MTPNKHTRRTLIGGLLAGLFGWLFVKKAPAVEQARQSSVRITLSRNTISAHSGVLNWKVVDSNRLGQNELNPCDPGEYTATTTWVSVSQ